MNLLVYWFILFIVTGAGIHYDLRIHIIYIYIYIYIYIICIYVLHIHIIYIYSKYVAQYNV